MAVKMINGLFGNEMYVAEERVEEYLLAGHKLAEQPKPAKAKKAPAKKSKKKE